MAVNFTPQVEPAPAWTPMIEPIPPENKISPLLAGEPPNSMATGNPKEYPSTETADPENESPDCPAPVAMASIAGSGVAVAAMVESAGSMGAAAGDIAAAAAAAIAERCASVLAEYSAKLIALPASVPGRIANYTAERIGKTKDDLDDLGKEFYPVKLSIGDFAKYFTSATEDIAKEAEDKANEKLKNDKIDEAKKKASKFVESANKIAAKSAETINQIMTHAIEGAEWIQKNIDKEVQRAEKNIRQELETGYKKVEKDIDEFSKSEGYKIGAQVVGLYNDTIHKQAKKLEDEKKKAVSQAKIKADQLIQKAKLQLFAIIGL